MFSLALSRETGREAGRRVSGAKLWREGGREEIRAGWLDCEARNDPICRG